MERVGHAFLALAALTWLTIVFRDGQDERGLHFVLIVLAVAGFGTLLAKAMRDRRPGVQDDQSSEDLDE